MRQNQFEKNQNTILFHKNNALIETLCEAFNTKVPLLNSNIQSTQVANFILSFNDWLIVGDSGVGEYWGH